MKKLIFTCLLITSASMVASAQTEAAAPPARPANKPIATEQIAEHHAKLDEQRYGLTTEQHKGVYDIEFEFATAMEKYRAEGKHPNVGQMGNLNARKDSKMKALMTPEQYAKYDADRSRQRMAPMAPGQQPQPGH